MRNRKEICTSNAVGQGQRTLRSSPRFKVAEIWSEAAGAVVLGSQSFARSSRRSHSVSLLLELLVM